jgi:hypothetical protein
LSNLLSHAEDELNRIGMTEDSPDEMNRMMRKHILHMMQEFANEGHSGFSASYAISILTKLMDFKPLSPLTGEDDEWVKHDYGNDVTYQNKRRSSVFKDADGSCYDIDGKVFWEWCMPYEKGEKPYKSYYTCRDSRVPVTFPYVVPDKPIYEYRHSDAEPQQPPQNENGFL